VIERKPLRLPGFDYRSCGAYMITICTRERACVLGRVVEDGIELGPAGRVVVEAWSSIPLHHPWCLTDAHVVMPDHVHGILIIDRKDRAGQVRPLHDVVGAFKAQASRRAGRALWQRGYHDRIIRNEDELTALRAYIAANPLRWLLRREGHRWV
jgi:REP element-mobilizing transposase RayT